MNAAASITLPATQIVFYGDLPYAARLSNGEYSPHLLATPSLLLPASQPPDVDRKREYALCYASQIDRATALEISNYTNGLGGRERFYAPIPAPERLRQRLT